MLRLNRLFIACLLRSTKFMKLSVVFLGNSSLALLCLLSANGGGLPATAVEPTIVAAAEIPRLQDRDRPLTTAQSLLDTAPTYPFASSSTISELAQASAPDSEQEDEDEEEIVSTGESKRPQSTPTYTIDQQEIQRQGANSVAETLKGLPGFAINDAGFGADIHTGTYYRGSSINQSVYLLNGRPLGTNVSTYHGNIDLNSIPVDTIDSVELSSGGSSTLFGSEAFGGVVNILTKPGGGVPRFSAGTQFGSFEQENYRGLYTGSLGKLDFALGYENYQAENDYKVPVGAANRDANGRLFNADTKTSNYYGRLSLSLDPRNTVSFDASKITARKGLIYLGFPLQRDRLDHDAFNTGLTWKALVGAGTDSVLNTSIGFSQDYFHTYGPTGRTFFREGTLDSRAFTTRVDHDWQINRTHNLRWGLDLRNEFLRGDTESNNPAVSALNEVERRNRFNTALFALNTVQLSNSLQAELGLRQNFNANFGSSLNPSLGLRWGANSSLALRGSWVSVRRLPGLDQLYVYDTVHNWLPNEDLKAERGSSWSGGMDVKFAPGLTGQFTYFGSSLRDRIATQPTRIGGRLLTQWQNIGRVNTNGAELALQWQIARQWKTFLNYTYTDARIASGADRGRQLALVPFSVAQLGVGYESNGWQVNLYTNYFSGARRSLFTLPTDSVTEFSPSWLNVDMNLRIPITQGLGLLVYLENLGGKTYERVNRLYQPGFTFKVGLTSNF